MPSSQDSGTQPTPAANPGAPNIPVSNAPTATKPENCALTTSTADSTKPIPRSNTDFDNFPTLLGFFLIGCVLEASATSFPMMLAGSVFAFGGFLGITKHFSIYVNKPHLNFLDKITELLPKNKIVAFFFTLGLLTCNPILWLGFTTAGILIDQYYQKILQGFDDWWNTPTDLEIVLTFFSFGIFLTGTTLLVSGSSIALSFLGSIFVSMGFLGMSRSLSIFTKNPDLNLLDKAIQFCIQHKTITFCFLLGLATLDPGLFFTFTMLGLILNQNCYGTLQSLDQYWQNLLTQITQTNFQKIKIFFSKLIQKSKESPGQAFFVFLGVFTGLFLNLTVLHLQLGLFSAVNGSLMGSAPQTLFYGLFQVSAVILSAGLFMATPFLFASLFGYLSLAAWEKVKKETAPTRKVMGETLSSIASSPSVIFDKTRSLLFSPSSQQNALQNVADPKSQQTQNASYQFKPG